jgi:predicted DNA-binding protein
MVHVIVVMQIVLRVNMASPNSSLTIRITEEEKAVLKAYCEQVTRRQSEVVRELIRSLESKIQK